MSAARLCLIAGLGSAGLLLGAWAFQHLGGLAPCKMCIWQRYPHGAAAVLGLIGFVLPLVWVALLGALATAVTAGIGAYHAGVEWGLLEGPGSCTSGPIGGLSAKDLLAQIQAAPVVRCDEVAWSLMGISMAGWNAILSAGLVAIWLSAARATRR